MKLSTPWAEAISEVCKAIVRNIAKQFSQLQVRKWSHEIFGKFSNWAQWMWKKNLIHGVYIEALYVIKVRCITLTHSHCECDDSSWSRWQSYCMKNCAFNPYCSMTSNDQNEPQQSYTSCYRSTTLHTFFWYCNKQFYVKVKPTGSAPVNSVWANRPHCFIA